MEPWDWWRALNLALAAIAFVVNLGKAIELRLFEEVLDLDSQIGFMGVLAWCVGYVAATSVAWLSGVPAGPWTAVMTVPILWTLVAGVLRPRNRKASRPA